MSISRSLAAAAACLIASPALAQMPSIGSVGKALGGIPSLSSAPVGNVAGVLSYCVKNKVLPSASANPTLSALTSKTGMSHSKDYLTGQNGNLVTGAGKSLSLANASSSVKSKTCDLVLKQAKSFL